MRTIIFSPAAFNLAETTRAIEIAKACRRRFAILFVSYGGEFENLIEKEGFEIRRLEPRLTPDKIKYLGGMIPHTSRDSSKRLFSDRNDAQ